MLVYYVTLIFLRKNTDQRSRSQLHSSGHLEIENSFLQILGKFENYVNQFPCLRDLKSVVKSGFS